MRRWSLQTQKTKTLIDWIKEQQNSASKELPSSEEEPRESLSSESMELNDTSTEITQAYFQSMMMRRVSIDETPEFTAGAEDEVSSSEEPGTGGESKEASEKENSQTLATDGDLTEQKLQVESSEAVEGEKAASIATENSANRKRNLSFATTTTTTTSKLHNDPMVFGVESERKRYAPSSKSNDTNSINTNDNPRNHLRPAMDENILPLAEGSFDQPHLMPTTTEDTEESPVKQMDAAPTTLLHTDKDADREINRREAISYLLRYETMVLQQEAEEMSTVQYILPLLERLQALGAGDEQQKQPQADLSNYSNANDALQGELWKRTISYGNLKLALDVLERSDAHQHSTQRDSAACMAGDSQLMMILKLLTKKHAVMAKKEDGDDNDDDSITDEVSITYAEIIHCYRVCILGMLTLKHLPKQSSVRSRAKDRIMSQLSLFEMPATKLLNESSGVVVDIGALDVASQALEGCNSGSNTQPSKSKHVVRKSRITTASLCIAAMSLSFGAGMMAVKPSSHSLQTAETVAALVTISDKEDQVHDDGSRKTQWQGMPTEFQTVNVTTPSLKRPALTPVREGLAYITSPREAPVNFQKLSDAQIGFEAASLVQRTSCSTDESSSSGEEQQSVPPPNHANQVWKSIPHGYQLVATALFGASAGVFGSPIVRFAIQSLSLGSLGVVPASLVVVGVFAVAANIFKGLRFVLHRFGLRKKRAMA